ncbi:MAG: aldo/keto reductase [Spirochaetia bacterium]|nr:aldo/keto reductase [Spirochaetia bacterium]
MKYQILGRSGMRVSEMCLGAMTFGEEWGLGVDQTESRKVFNLFLDSGGNFIDTANKYNEGTSEMFLGDFMKGLRNQIVLATKYTMNMNDQDPNAGGNHRKNMVLSVEESLRRLKTDYIDLYWLHMWDYTTPAEEVMRALDDLIRSGKILHIGASDTPAWIIARSNTFAELRGWTQFTALQLKYNLLERTIEREFTEMAREFNIAVTSWAPLNYGILTGKYSLKDGKLISADNSKRYSPDQGGFLDKRKQEIIQKLRDISERKNLPMSQIALAWVRQKGVLPIVGAKTESQLKENLGYLQHELSVIDMSELEEASKIDLGFPHEFLHRDGIRERIFGDTYTKFDGLKL